MVPKGLNVFFETSLLPINFDMFFEAPETVTSWRVALEILAVRAVFSFGVVCCGTLSERQSVLRAQIVVTGHLN